jgi:thiol-disulfide isomerase/thioredoxin
VTATIRIDPPLPCCALIMVRRRCSRPAAVAQATRLVDGSYHLQPFCAACVAAMAKLYEVEQEYDDEAPQPRPPFPGVKEGY